MSQLAPLKIFFTRPLKVLKGSNQVSLEPSLFQDEHASFPACFQSRGAPALRAFCPSSGLAPTGPCPSCVGTQSWMQDSRWGLTRPEGWNHLLQPAGHTPLDAQGWLMSRLSSSSTPSPFLAGLLSIPSSPRLRDQLGWDCVTAFGLSCWAGRATSQRRKIPLLRKLHPGHEVTAGSGVTAG